MDSHGPLTNGIRTFHVLVLTCGDLGVDVAARIRELSSVGRVSLVIAPYRERTRTLFGTMRQAYHRQGVAGLISGAFSRIRRIIVPPRRTVLEPFVVPDGVAQYRVDEFHSANAIALIARLRPDLGVVAGTYVLRESVFGIPRLGCINLHSGKAPAYRGAAPAFWELMNGETEVGITVHRVTSGLDAGDIVLQETFPLNPAPGGDVEQYITHYRTTVLRPNGVRMLVEATRQVLDGCAHATPQDSRFAVTYKTPGHSHVRELRKRVKRRREASIVQQ